MRGVEGGGGELGGDGDSSKTGKASEAVFSTISVGDGDRAACGGLKLTSVGGSGPSRLDRR